MVMDLCLCYLRKKKKGKNEFARRCVLLLMFTQRSQSTDISKHLRFYELLWKLCLLPHTGVRLAPASTAGQKQRPAAVCRNTISARAALCKAFTVPLRVHKQEGNFTHFGPSKLLRLYSPECVQLLTLKVPALLMNKELWVLSSHPELCIP